MAKYEVRLYETIVLTIVLEAENEADAEVKARDALYEGVEFHEETLGTDDRATVLLQEEVPGR